MKVVLFLVFLGLAGCSIVQEPDIFHIYTKLKTEGVLDVVAGLDFEFGILIGKEAKSEEGLCGYDDICRRIYLGGLQHSNLDDNETD